MELTLWIFGGVLFIFSLILWNLGTKFDVQKEHCFELENNIILLENRIDKLESWNEDKNKHIFSLEQKLIVNNLGLNDLVVNTLNKTKQLEERLIALEQRKQSEIRANYNMDFTHINTDI